MSDVEPAVLEAMKAQLTCHVCLNIFEDPRSLPCRHSICLNCYTREFNSQNRSVSCITCRQVSKVRPEDLPVDHATKGMLEVYHGFASSTTSSSAASSMPRNVRVKQTCFIPGCNKKAEQKGPISQLELCRQHFDQDVANLRVLNVQIDKKSQEQVGPKGWLSGGISNLENVIQITTERQAEVGPTFRQLDKALKMKREELEAGFDSKLNFLHGELKKMKETQQLIKEMKSSLDLSMKKSDFNKAEKLIRQMQTVLKSFQSLKRFKPALVSQSLDTLSQSINSSLDNCSFKADDNILIRQPEDLSEMISGKNMRDRVVEIPYEVSSFTVCSDMNYYYHDNTYKDYKAMGVTGRVTKTPTKDPLPPQCLLCCFSGDVIHYHNQFSMMLNEASIFDAFQFNSGVLVVYSLNGEAVSLVDVNDTNISLSNSIFFYDNETQSLFVCDNANREVVRMDLTGVIYSRTVLQQSHMSNMFMDYMSMGNMSKGNMFVHSLDVSTTTLKHGSLGYLLIAIHGDAAQRRVQRGFGGVRDNNATDIRFYDIMEGDVKASGHLSYQKSAYAKFGCNKVYILSTNNSNQLEVYVLSAETRAQEMTIQLTGLSELRPIGMCLANKEGIMFMREQNTCKVVCLNIKNGEMLGYLPIKFLPSKKNVAMQNFPQNRKSNDRMHTSDMSLCFSTCKGLQSIVLFDMDAKCFHFVDLQLN